MSLLYSAFARNSARSSPDRVARCHSIFGSLVLHQDAQRCLRGIRLSELVGRELVGQDRLVRLIGGIRRLEVDDRSLAVEVRDEVDDADEGQVPGS